MHGCRSNTLHSSAWPGRGETIAAASKAAAPTTTFAWAWSRTRIDEENKRRLAPRPGYPGSAAEALIRPIEQGAAVGAAAFQARQIASVAHAPAVVQPIVVDTGNEDAAAVRLAGSPACVGDAHRGREAQALRRAAMQLRFRHERLLQVPALACAGERHPGECQQ